MNQVLRTPAITAGRVRLDAELLKARRHQLGLSQEAFALACFERQLCVSIASVKRAETGKSLLLRTARHLAEFHGLDVQSLLHAAALDEDEPSPEPAFLSMPTHAGQGDARLVQLLWVWPVSEQERQDILPALQTDGATLMPVASSDVVLLAFGLPRAQRQDVQRCLNAASLWPGKHALICSGRWQGEEELDWPQDVVQTWVRRQMPSVYVHRSVHGQVRALHLVEPTGHGDIGRLGPAHGKPQRMFRLAGRQHEMRLFEGLLHAVLTDQQSQVMMVQGMAGMGKSRLLAEMVDVAQQHFLSTALIEIQDFGGDRHREVVVALLKSLLGLQAATPFWSQLVGQRLAPYGLPPEQALVCKDLLAVALADEERKVLEAMGHAARGQAMVQALSRVLSRMALQRPILLVVEDVHWASASIIETLARTMSACQESQILWVLSSRVESPHRLSDLQRLIPDVAVASLNLVPLRANEVRDLVEQFDHVDDAWRLQCIQRAQGHPLFLTQLLVADRHAQLPDSFQHLLQVRLDEVSPQDRHALRLAAVLGQAFSAEDICALMQTQAYELDALVQHCLLRRLEDGRHDFLHALIRQGVYEALPERQRQAMHIQVARHFEPMDQALWARHLHLARQAQAPAALLGAARARHDVFDHEGALSLLKLYGQIDYAPRDEHAHATALGDVHAKMGEMPLAREAYEKAIAHADDVVASLTAKVALAGVLNVLEDLRAEEALIDEAMPVAESSGAQKQLAAMHYLKGNLYFPRGDVLSSRLHHGRAMELAQACGAARLQAQALSGLGDSYYAEGLMATANARFVQCLALCDEHGLRDIEASNRFMLATTQIYLCQTHEALRQAQASADLARRVGNRRAEIVSRLTAAWVELGRGRAREAVAQIDEGLLISRTIGAMRFEPFLLESQARALYMLGDEAGAQRIIQQALEGVERQRLHAFIGPWVMGTWALLNGHAPQEALAMLARAEKQVAQGCVAHNVFRFHASAMEVLTLLGAHDEAVRLGAAWLQRTGQEPTPWVQSLHAFMLQCAQPGDRPHPDHPLWCTLRDQQILHVMLKLPRSLLG